MSPFTKKNFFLRLLLTLIFKNKSGTVFVTTHGTFQRPAIDYFHTILIYPFLPIILILHTVIISFKRCGHFWLLSLLTKQTRFNFVQTINKLRTSHPFGKMCWGKVPPIQSHMLEDLNWTARELESSTAQNKIPKCCTRTCKKDTCSKQPRR